MKTFLTSCVLLTLVSAADVAHAQQTYPARPIRMLVPFAPGGGTDISARVIGQKMTEQLHQTIIVDNRTGASGHIAMEIAARAAPDGYTLIMSTVAPMAFSPALFKSLPFDTLKDYAPVALASSTVFAIVVPPSLPAKNLRELIALARSQPGKMTYASGGTGGASHIATELMQLMAGTSMVHVPYKGGGAALPEVMSGQVSLLFADVIGARGYVAAGKLRALGVTSKVRSKIMPDVPTISEAGLPGYEMTSWNGVLAPAGTPRPIVDRLNAVIVRVLPLPDVAEKLAGDGSEFGRNTPEQFAAFVRSEYAKWGKIIRQAKIRIE
ncbi:MAG TPA: tripartite tricarboxylate transporter substrate binding protein [Burkholderiales bacterium]|nr:tripartite tricarboxylate transporter substrate binding protein [Burkholderiales bacterium]